MKVVVGDNLAIKIAMVAHEANRAWCVANGDNSQPKWDEAPDWQVSSAIAGVKFHFANREAGPEASHESWMKMKLEEGWVYGEVKSPENKTHPCIVPFLNLPWEQQQKDRIFRAIVHSFFNNVTDIEIGGNK